MNSFKTFISKHLFSFLTLILLIVFLNGIILLITFRQIVFQDYGPTAPPNMLELIASDSSPDGISESSAALLRDSRIWAMYLNEKGTINWSVALPPEIPSFFTLQDIAILSRGYLKDYPVFVRSQSEGLLILGYPRGSYTKLLSNSYSLRAIRQLPVFLGGILILDLLLLFFAYCCSRKKILQNTEPMIRALEKLSLGIPVEITATGELNSLADSIQKVSLILSRQNAARANWIDGISHDIRTPLSVIMGYAGKLSGDSSNAAPVREQAKIIEKQSLKISGLVQDMNLVSRLEYDMQPLCSETVLFSRLLRSYTADLLNEGIPAIYTISLTIEPEAEKIFLLCDRRLLTRAVNNLVQNSIRHNPFGCHIDLHLSYMEHSLHLSVSDNGIGLSEEKRKALCEKPHYMESAESRLDLRHGLGIILVKEIVKAHGGSYQMDTEYGKGYRTTLTFPASFKKPVPSL